MGEMSSEAEEGRYGHAQACANSGLESLAAEASRRAESMDRDLDSRTERTERTENNDTDTKSPSRSSGPRGKVRKAYTITKQRERWTEEEHDRFLQALKRYGRAWRKIEEHIGTKTAVQIRSHAQKFFSKLQREQSMNGGRDESSKNDISIPPPRPKRKPMHPYPRNSIDSASGDHGEPSRAAHQDPKPHPRRESLATTSTQAPASTPQYSNSSNYQPAQPVLNHVPLFHGQPSPFAGMSLAQQPSHVQLPPFPSLDTSGGENMSKVLKDAAVAAASAWNQVIAGATQKVQHQIQAQSYPPPSNSALPMWGMPQYQEATGQNPFIPQLLAHVAAQQSASQQFLHAASSQSANPALASSIRQPHATAFTHSTGQRYKHMHDADKTGVADSDRESRGSEEGATARNFALDAPAQGGLGRWSNKQHHSLAEAKLGRTAWEMMNQVTAQKSREVNLEEARAGPSTKAPIKGDIGGSRRIRKPVPHSPRISPRSDAIPSLLSGGRSDTSQLAQFYQQAAASTAERDRQAYGNGSSGNGENGSTGDKGSSDGARSDEANGQLIKDNGSNNRDEGASPRMKDLGKSPFGGGKGEKNSTNDLVSNFAVPNNGSLPGSDKASNTGSGSGSDEDGITNASDMAGTRGDEKASNEGSNSERASPRDTSYLKDGSQSATKAGLDLQTTRREQHPKAAAPHSFEAAWAAASLQSQQQAVQMALKQGRPSQAELMQQILPFTLTPQQQQAITTWAAANSQSQPHQFHMMQSLLAGFTSPNSDYSTMGGNRMMDRQISSLTSADTGSHTECNTAIPGCAFGFGGRASAPAESLCKRSSGFQPYSKRPADSSLAAPAAKRFSPGKDHLEKGSLSTPEFKFTPFGTLAVQSEQVQ